LLVKKLGGAVIYVIDKKRSGEFKKAITPKHTPTTQDLPAADFTLPVARISK